MLVRSFFILCALVTITIAGPNADAVLHFDFEPSTDAIESETGCPEGDDFTMAVVIEDAVDLFSYEFYIDFDSSSLEFLSAKKGSNAYPNFLEGNDGSIFFNSKISEHDETRVLIGCSLTGNDLEECGSGDGILCLVTFTHKKDDTTHVEISDPSFINYDDVEDTELESVRGTILNESVNVRRQALKHRSQPAISRNKYSTTIDFSTSTSYELVVVNTQGRIVHTDHGYSNRVAINHRGFSGGRCAAGMNIVRLRAEGNELVVPLLFQ